MTDYTFALVGIMLLEMIMILPFAIFMKLGGYPEGFYRMARMKYFVFWILDADNTLIRGVKLFKEIKTHSPSYFDHGAKRFFIDRNNTLRSKGRPAWLYIPTNAFPVPVLTQRDKELDPEKIKKAFRTQMLKDWFRIREGDRASHSNILRYVLYGFIFLVVLGIGFYLFGRPPHP